MKIFPIFIPFYGCPQRCCYCQQGFITKTTVSNQLSTDQFLARDLDQKLAQFSSKYRKTESEIAFYGGSFTMLSEDERAKLLASVKPFINRISGIRISTRPDGINEGILTFCKENNINTIELGVQSFSNEVLIKTNRSYTRDVAVNACKMIQANNISLGIQLMPGLPGFSTRSLQETITTALEIKPDFIRIYPTLVLKSTELEQMYIANQYQALTIASAITICCNMINAFEEEQIKVIKVGLHSDLSSDESNVISGPYHPAFRELVNRELLFRSIKEELRSDINTSKDFIDLPASNRVLAISDKAVSLLLRDNHQLLKKIKKLLNIGSLPVVFDPSLPAVKANVVNSARQELHQKIY